MRNVGLFLIALISCCCPALAKAQATTSTGDRPEIVRVAAMQAPLGTSLDDLLKGRVVPGFSPVLSSSVSFASFSEQHAWIRLRIRLPEKGAESWQVRVDRRGIQNMVAYFDSGPGPVAALSHRPGLGATDRRFPDSLYVPLPRQWRGEHTLYLEISGSGYLVVEPRLMPESQSQRNDRRAEFFYGAIYLVFFLGIVLAFARKRLEAGSRMVETILWAFVMLIACMVFNGHAESLPGGIHLLAVGPNLGIGLFVIAAGQSLWVTRDYAGMERHAFDLSSVYDKAGWFLLMLGMAVTYLPTKYLGTLQTGLLLLWIATAFACLGGLAMDTRRTRWSAMFIWCGLVLAMLAMVMTYQRVLPATSMARVGFQLLLGLLVLVHVLLPWTRSLLRARQMKQRKPEPVISPEEKIRRAREQLMAGLNSALKAATEGDLEWIAFRRLLEGLKPVLPQAASAVIAMNYHSEDLLLVEPKDAKDRYAMLLGQRGNLLRNLSRSTAPQQIVIDFDGPEGPLEHVQLAVIPLPIGKPGWGALLVERVVEHPYSDLELDMCAEFAALATTAGEEAAYAMQERRAAEIDQDVGVYRQVALEPILNKTVEAAVLQRLPYSVLHVALDGFLNLPAAQRLPAMHAIADLVREEAEYGQTLGRMGEDGLLLIVPGRQIGLARELAERICAAARKHRAAGLPGIGFNVSIGVAQLQPGERSPQQMMARLAQAFGKAREYGGNQAQATDSAVL